MNVLHRRCGEQVCATESLTVAILSINKTVVSFAISDSTTQANGDRLSRPLADACRNKLCYFWFPKGGPFTLVARCEIGRNDLVLGAVRLRLVGLTDGAVDIAVSPVPRSNTTVCAKRPNHQRSDHAGFRPLLSWPHWGTESACAVPAMHFRWNLVRRVLIGPLVAMMGAIIPRW